MSSPCRLLALLGVRSLVSKRTDPYTTPYILIILRNNTEYSSTAVLEIWMGGVQILVVDGCKIAAMR